LLDDVRVIDAGVDVSSGSELAFLQATTRDKARLDIIASGQAGASQADDYVNIYYDDLYQSLTEAESRLCLMAPLLQWLYRVRLRPMPAGVTRSLMM